MNIAREPIALPDRSHEDDADRPGEDEELEQEQSEEEDESKDLGNE